MESNMDVDHALLAIGDADRNVRVRALHVLARQPGDKAAPGILRALSDPSRRVRRLAVRSSAAFAGLPEIEERLRELVDDQEDTPKIRGSAFHALMAGGLLSRLHDYPSAKQHFENVSSVPRQREFAIQVLVSLDPLTEPLRSLLETIVETGTAEEAVLANRALSGFRVINLGGIAETAERRRIAQTCVPAWGRVWYWVPRERN